MPDGVNTEKVPNTLARARGLDAMDRKILSLLAQDAARSLATIGAEVGLSAPAVHERVRRLRASGAIRGTVALVDGAKVGKALLAFVHVDTTGWGKTKALMALAELPEVEEIHSATGDCCLIMKVRVASSVALEGLLARLYDVPGVRGTRTYVALTTHLERPVQADITEELLDEGPRLK
jgi:Lrp/AsnC family leucine-responsive transcriptional regulator